MVAHDSRADELVEEDGSYCNGSHTTILLGYLDKPCPFKEVLSEKWLWDETQGFAAILLTQLADGIDCL